MTDEIKEILDGLNQITIENKESKNPLICTLISFEVLYKLLDYITNLQKKLNLANNIVYDYLYKDKKITKELYDKFKGGDKDE